ncbi:MAG: hypothetical protein BWK75_06275 [Candidatus Altiarchaeales archaeon A3]|nr:MAG: hypothetical protein BWK75_06275 [Candidatus Altiarchaeales archaeon A3]
MDVKVIKSARRRRTVSTKRVNGEILLYVSNSLSNEKIEKYIEWAKKRFEASDRKKNLVEGDANKNLENMAKELNKEYFNNELKWNKIEYSTEQNSKMFGNCHTMDKIIRISDRLLKMPKFVHDYVVVHELAHLKVSGHNEQFWNFVKRYEKMDMAKGYLMAVAMED